MPLSEKQIPQVVENLERGGKPKEALERAAMRPRQVRMAWEELILATPASLLSRSVGSLHPGCARCRIRLAKLDPSAPELGLRTSLSKLLPNGTLVTSDAPLAQTPISSQMVSYPCNPSRESPDERRTSWGEHYIERAQKFRACSIGKAARSANKLLTGHSEAIQTKGGRT